jgi:uncharacterized lipoprotein YddW (UPF0748 family)
VCATLLALTVTVGAAPAEMRAFYAATFDINTQAACQAIVDDVLTSNFNAVFVEVRGRADAYYYPNREDSTYPNSEPRGQLYTISPSNFDALQFFIDELHAASPRVEVHAWLTTYNSWNRVSPPASAAHVYNAHPEWITENAAGVTYTSADDAPLDPGIPAVNDHIYNVFMDIVRNYDIDGIHFDYIRLLGANSGYDSVAKAQFLADTGWNYDTQNGAGQLDEVYEAWRRDRITQVVQRVYDQTKLEKPWVEVSTFLVNFSDSVEILGQGYNWWVAHGAVDFLVPGCYASNVAGTISDWDFFIGKLSQNGDQNTRRLVAAIGTYLLDSAENVQAVNDLRAHARPTDGFDFFAYSALYEDGTPADEYAMDLFNGGGPMDTDAPVPTYPHQTALGAEATPPNAPAAASASLVGGMPRVTFNRPAAAGDGDLPVHYRLYRDGDASVDLTYVNMVMEWWDLASTRSSFTFDDALAPVGTHHYAVVAYDNWNNAAQAAAGSATVASSSATHIIETRAGGLNVGQYSEESGTWANSTAHSTAPGTTPGIGSRFALPGDADGRNERARFTPTGIATGTYNVEVTCFDFASANAEGITVRISDSDGVSTTTMDLTQATAGDVWTAVGTMDYVSGQGHHVEFDNATQTNIGDSTNSRMNPAAVRLVGSVTPTPKESKSPVSPPASGVTEIIIDSTPQALDYDDLGSAAAWATSTLAGHYNGNARFFSSANFPVNDYAVWFVDLPRAGRWAIDGWVRNNASFAAAAQYRFVDGTGTLRNVSTTQQAPPDSTTTGGWFIDVDGVSDANAYQFQEGRLFITLYGNGAGSQTLIADALRFRFVEAIPVGISVIGSD